MVDQQELETTLDAQSSDELDEEANRLLNALSSAHLTAQAARFQGASDTAAPTGTWSGAPALAASTVSMTNTTAWPVEVYITGGTWTVLKKNGVTITGATSANVGTVPFKLTLRPGATWAVTYSVAPTAQWLYA